MRLATLAIICWACTPGQPEDKSSTSAVSTATYDTTQFRIEDYNKLESYLTTSRPEKETEIVDYDCAVFISPNSDQIEEMKKDGEEDFYTIADDNTFYDYKAAKILDTLRVKTIRPKGQFLRMVGGQRTWDIDMRKKNLPAWNLILFRKNKEPRIVDSIDLTADLVKEYFDLGN